MVPSSLPRWPGVEVDPATLRAWLDARSAQHLAQERLAELALTCACASGDAGALAEFEKHFMPAAEAGAARFGEPELVGEVCQMVRRQLLLKEGDREPRIAEFRGLGDLAGYVKAVAVRSALNLLAARGRTAVAGTDDEMVAVPAPADDPELAVMKVRYRDDFKRAFGDAMATLPPRTGTILRLYYLDGLGLADLGRLYGWSVPTASRRLAAARADVAVATRALMVERLAIAPHELDSVMRLIESHLSVEGLATPEP